MKSKNYYYKFLTLHLIFVNVCAIVLAILAVDASHDNCDPEEKGLAPPFYFSYRERQELTLKINFINISPNVTYKLYETEIFKSDSKSNLTKKGPKMVQQFHRKEDKECFSNKRTYEVKNNLYSILLEISSSNASWCQNVTIFEGRLMYTDNEVSSDKYKYNSECSHSYGCTILVNLTHECTDTRNVITTEEPSSKSGEDDDDDDVVSTSPRINIDTATIISTASYEHTSEEAAHHAPTCKSNVVAYVIPAVIVICVIILIIYIWVKKHYSQHSQPVETLELDTYATASDLVYADLNLVQGNGLPPRIDEGSPYAQIIGVMKPVDK